MEFKVETIYNTQFLEISMNFQYQPTGITRSAFSLFPALFCAKIDKIRWVIK